MDIATDLEILSKQVRKALGQPLTDIECGEYVAKWAADMRKQQKLSPGSRAIIGDYMLEAMLAAKKGEQYQQGGQL